MALINNPGGSTPGLTGVLDSINRGGIAGNVGAPVDIANMILGVTFPGLHSEKPIMGSEWIGDQMRKAGLVSETRQPLGEMVAGLAGPVAGLAKNAFKSIGKVAKEASVLTNLFPEVRAMANTIGPAGEVLGPGGNIIKTGVAWSNDAPIPVTLSKPDIYDPHSMAQMVKEAAEATGYKQDRKSYFNMLHDIKYDSGLGNAVTDTIEDKARFGTMDYNSIINNKTNVAKTIALDKEYGSTLREAHSNFKKNVADRLDISIHNDPWETPTWAGRMMTTPEGHFLDLQLDNKQSFNDVLYHELNHAALSPLNGGKEHMSDALTSDIMDIVAPVHNFVDDPKLLSDHSYLTGVGFKGSNYNDTTEIMANLITGPRVVAAEKGIIPNIDADFTLKNIQELATADPRYARFLELVGDPDHYLKMLNKLTPVALMSYGGSQVNKKASSK